MPTWATRPMTKISGIAREQLSKYHKASVFTREENPCSACSAICKQKVSEKLTLYLVNNPQGTDGYI